MRSAARDVFAGLLRLQVARPGALMWCALAEADAPIGEVITLFDFLPEDQDDKLELLAEARALIQHARDRGFIEDGDWRKIAHELAKLDTRPIGVEDLPLAISAPFTEKDGSRGRVVYVVPAEGHTLNDARYLTAWADAVRETTLPDGSVVHGSGRSVVFADLVLVVLEDAPRSILLSLALTCLVVIVAFRGRRSAWVALATLLVGFSWMLGFMALYGLRAGADAPVELVGMKLNFLNVVALPVTIGIGADYALNIVQRQRAAGAQALATVVTETGGAVLLCSLTTTVGYLALTISSSRAIQSFGIAAAAGEIACVVTAVLVLPACIAWRQRRPCREFDNLPAERYSR